AGGRMGALPGTELVQDRALQRRVRVDEEGEGEVALHQVVAAGARRRGVPVEVDLGPDLAQVGKGGRRIHAHRAVAVAEVQRLGEGRAAAGHVDQAAVVAVLGEVEGGTVEVAVPQDETFGDHQGHT